MERIKCPCCGYFSHQYNDTPEYPYPYHAICKICFWQYDEVAHDKPDISIGANHISLNKAKENYKKYAVCQLEFINNVRLPLMEEMPENNI